MENLYNFDEEFEADSLAMFFDWYDDRFVPSFLQSDSPNITLQDSNLMKNFNFQTELTPVASSSAVVESTDETQVQLKDATSWIYQGLSSEMTFTFVPNPLQCSLPNTFVLNGTQLSHPLSSAEGAGSSMQGQDMSQTGCPIQLTTLQIENLLAFEDIQFYGEQNLNNQLSVTNTVENSNFNDFNINHSCSNAALVHPNTVQAGSGNETYSTGLFVPPQTTAFSPLQAPISNSHTASRPVQTEFSAPDIFRAQDSTYYMQSFTTAHSQVGHASNLPYQNSIRPVNPMYPRWEPQSTLDPAFVTMPPNPYEQDYRPVLPEPAVPSASLIAYGQQSSLSGTNSSYGSGSTITPTNKMYYPLYENQDQHHHHQVMMPNYQGQQSGASVQLWSQGVLNQISTYNQRMNTPNLPWQSSTSSQTTEGSSSRVSNSRKVEIAPRVQEEATIRKNEVPTSQDKGNIVGTSSTRSQPSEAIRRILDMNPSRLVSRCMTGQIQTSQQIGRVNYEAPSRGRPPKRCFAEELYLQRGKWPKVSSEIGNAGTTSTSQQAQQALHTPYSVLNIDRNAIPTNLPSAPRQYVNTVYDVEFERQGHPIDPHLRLFKPPPGK